MATNYEFYKDKVLNWIEQEEGSDGCVAALYENLSGNFRGCETECRECGKVLVDFLKQEHIEQPKLTKRERALCEAVQTGWIARDCNMHLYYFSGKPELKQGTWMTRVVSLYNLKVPEELEIVAIYEIKSQIFENREVQEDA